MYPARGSEVLYRVFTQTASQLVLHFFGTRHRLLRSSLVDRGMRVHTGDAGVANPDYSGGIEIHSSMAGSDPP